MKKTRLFFVGTGLVMVAAMFFAVQSCKKSAQAEDTSYATDYSVAEKASNDVQTVADQVSTVSGSANLRTTGGNCATITRTFNGPDSVVTIDFGSTDCLCRDGSYRRGAIIVTFSGHYADSGSVRNITFNNYYHNDNNIGGSKTVTNMGHNAQGQIYFNVSDNFTITGTNGEVHSANWTRVRTWVTQGDPNIYSITGSGTLVRPNNRSVGVNITEPLVVASNCRWIEEGTVAFSLPNGLSRSINYGSTAVCDDMAILTLANGKTETITLK